MTRDDILDAAAQVIRKKGFHAASMADIANVVNLQKASLYHHVSSKQEILLELLDRALEMLTARIAPIVNQSIPADEKLRLMIAYICNHLLRTLTSLRFCYSSIGHWIKNLTLRCSESRPI